MIQGTLDSIEIAATITENVELTADQEQALATVQQIMQMVIGLFGELVDDGEEVDFTIFVDDSNSDPNYFVDVQVYYEEELIAEQKVSFGAYYSGFALNSDFDNKTFMLVDENQKPLEGGFIFSEDIKLFLVEEENEDVVKLIFDDEKADFSELVEITFLSPNGDYICHQYIPLYASLTGIEIKGIKYEDLHLEDMLGNIIEVNYVIAESESFILQEIEEESPLALYYTDGKDSSKTIYYTVIYNEKEILTGSFNDGSIYDGFTYTIDNTTYRTLSLDGKVIEKGYIFEGVSKVELVIVEDTLS